VPQEILDNLPVGIYQLQSPDKLPARLKEVKDEDIVIIKDFAVNVQEVEIKGLKKLRSYWPMTDYKLLKNRKSARE
jgi:hypothetical protein